MTVVDETRCTKCDRITLCTRGDDGPHTLFHEHSGSRFCDETEDPLYAEGSRDGD